MARRSVRKIAGALLVASGLVLCAAVVFRQAQEKEADDVQKKRAEWFYRQRAYPNPYVPAGARQLALGELDTKLQAETRQRAASPTAPLASWSYLGPQPIQTPYTDPLVSGRVTALAVDPQNADVVYLGGAQGGVWKTIDGGSNWTPLTDAQPSTAIGSLAIDPANHNVIYAGTGEENFSGDSYYGAGILKSTDAGATWAQLCWVFCGPVGPDSYYGGGAHIGGLAVSPANSQVLLAAVALLGGDGVYRSSNGANSWTRVLTGAPGNAVLFDPANGNIAYAAMGAVFSGQTEGVFKSTDGGQTWNPANGSAGSSLDLTKAGRIVLAIAPSSSNTLYASLGDVTNGTLLGFYKTTDGGAHWTLLPATPDYCTFQCGYDNVVAVQPGNPNVVYAGGAYTTTLVRSTDGGTSWSTLQSAQNGGFLHADMHALAFSSDGQTLYLGNDGGAYVTTQVTAAQPSFTALNNTLGLIQFYPGIANHPTNPNFVLGGTQDNGTVLYSGVPAWDDVVCGDGGYAAIDFNTPATMYAACQQISIYRSTNSGSFGSWISARGGINLADRVDFIPPLVMDPSNPQTLYFGTYRVYRTTNGAASWSAISPDLTGGDNFFGVISTIAVAASNSNVVYIGALDGSVQVTSNAGAGAAATWTNIKTVALPPRVITNVAVDPANSAVAYLAFSGFKNFGDSLGHIFRTTNTGATWTDISGDLPNIPVNYLLTLTNAPNTLFAATDVGVFYTTNGGTHWTPLVNGLPRVAVLGLALQASSHKLRAATHGRGMWEIDINSVLTPLQLTGAVSRKTHTGFGAFDVNLPLSGDPAIECRGGNHTIIFNFTNNLTSGSATVTGGPGSVSGTPSITGNTLTVNLAGVTDVSVVTITLHAVTDTTAQVLPDTPLAIGFLLGDVNGDRSTNSADALITRNRSGQDVNATNFRSDFNLDGSINSADATIVRSRSGQGLPQSVTP